MSLIEPLAYYTALLGRDVLHCYLTERWAICSDITKVHGV
jgi:hypothetical protein